MSTELHAGHRERIRTRYAESGGEGFLDHQFLELLLTYAIPRRDTNELAHALLVRFGSLERVCNASVQETMQVPGIGESAAVFLQMQGDLLRRVSLHRLRDPRGQILLNTPFAASSYAYIQLHSKTNETVQIVCLNSKRILIHSEILQIGSLTEARVYPRNIAEIALLRHAHSVLLLHNHPSGDPTPSGEDAAVTEAVRNALAGIEISLADHLVVGGAFVYSFSADVLIDLAADPPATLTLSDYAAYLHKPQPVPLQRVMESY